MIKFITVNFNITFIKIHICYLLKNYYICKSMQIWHRKIFHNPKNHEEWNSIENVHMRSKSLPVFINVLQKAKSTNLI